MCLYKKEDTMSKRFQKVLTNAFHVSFLETIHDPCERSYSLMIQAQSDDPAMRGGSMYVKLCHSQEECAHYEILLDESGKGSITISDLQANTQTIVLTDACGNQIINGDGQRIVYEVDGQRQQEDHARLFTEDGKEQYSVRVTSELLVPADLRIVKKVMLKGELQDPHENECFTIRLQGQGISRLLTLDGSNAFMMELKDLPYGRYTMEELDEMGDTIYRLNGMDIMDGILMMEPGDNTLEIINTAAYDTSLTLAKYVRNTKGELCRPQRLECYSIRVVSDRQDVIVTLDEENDFCTTLRGLFPGYYSIMEENSSCDTSYIINDSCEKRYANLEITECGEHTVRIINTPETYCDCQQESQLRICKFIRSKDGCLVKPCSTENFQVTISGCGMCQTLNLNESNNFCVDIASLCSGVYNIEETGCGNYVSSYIVNDDMERTSACIQVREESTYCVTIINSKWNAGSLRVCKYIRNDHGDLIKPNKDQCFDMTLSSLFNKECFTLNAENNWCMCFDDLRRGGYEIREQCCEPYLCEYQVDHERPCRHARFMMDGCDREVRVINYIAKDICGTLRISKFEETQSGELVKPQRDEQFHVFVEGQGFSECYTLKASNNWCIMLDGLKAGEYHIQEEEGELYEAVYTVHGERCEEATITLGECNEEVCILNHRKRCGILEIEASMQDCDGAIDLPYEGMELEVLVEGKETCYHVCLNKDNNWCVLLDQLPNDTYRIIQKDNFGFAIRYIVDGVDQDFARISMNREDHHISIINEMVNCAGMVKVTKYMEDEYGNLLMPCKDQQFTFELSGTDFCNTYTLCERNDFCVYFDDLMQGCYEIKELDTDCTTRYLLNQQPYEKACFTLGKEDIYVDIINKPKEDAGVIIEKRIRKGTSIVKPQGNDCYKILLTGRNVYEIFELNEENDFCICLNDLKNQHYEIKELSGNPRSYLVNGCEQENGYFLYEGKTCQITIINEEESTGALRLEKLIEDDCGSYVRPQRWESFEVLIESDCFKRKVTLDIRNNFCVCLYDIPSGHYEIKELDACGKVSYIIHDIPCESAIIDLVNEDVNVTIINHTSRKGCLHFQGFVEKEGVVVPADPLDEFVLVITAENFSQSIVLHAGNDFCADLKGLDKNAYTITECGKEDICFAIENQRFEDVVCVELNGEFVEINVIKTKKKDKEKDITIRKWMVDASGRRQKPSKEDSFVITLLYKGRKQMFELNAQNEFTKVLQHQQPGSYEIREDSDHASFRINGGNPTKDGCFTLCEESIEIDVCNPIIQSGTVMLQMLEQTQSDALVSPQKDTVYEVELSGEDGCETLRFTQDNQWKMKKKLAYGMYQVKVSGEKDVYFFIDHEKKQEGIFHLDSKGILVQAVIRHPRQTGSILLQKYIRSMDCDCFHRPTQDGVYEIEVIGDHDYQTICLNQENHYQKELEQLEDGRYEIKELHVDHVTYIVNGGMEEHKGIVTVCGNRNQVKIINEADHEAIGSIEICKLMKDKEGCYCYPKPEEAYWIVLKGETQNSRVLLNEANHFYASIRNLMDGWYEVMEEHGSEDTRYVVNNGAPMKKGIVHVVSNANTVNVINPLATETGSLQLNKWFKQHDRLVKPSNGEFRVHISAEGYQNMVVLNQANGYQISLDHLSTGSYEIKELDHEHVSYVIDHQGGTDQAIVHVDATGHQVDIINQCEHKGSISMVKYRRIHQQLVRPNPTDSYEFYLSAPGYQKLFYLDQGNEWNIKLDDLAAGSYVLNERNAKDEVSYIIDAQSEVDRAVIEVSSDDHQVTIINTPKDSATGSMHIQKVVRENDQLKRPADTQSYQLVVTKPGFQQRYTLDAGNNFTLHLHDLSEGVYMLEEQGDSTQVSYIIDGGTETANGVVEVHGDNHQVIMINASTPADTGSIQVEKFIRENNQLNHPSTSQSYRLHVSKPGFNEVYTLDASNDFHVQLNALEDGFYVLDELDEQGEVSYIINSGSETRYGIVEVRGNENQVMMINTPSADNGSIFFSKYIKNPDGSTSIPADGDTYTIEVYHQDFLQRVVLNSQNHFQSVLSNLREGIYHLRELDSSTYRVTYKINGSEETSQGIVYVQGNARNMVDVINERTVNLNTVEVFKYMLDKDGNYLPPGSPDTYRFEVSAPGFTRSYDLTPANNWHVVLTDLSAGTYRIQEVTQDASRVRYLVNSAQLQPEAYFTATPDVTNVVGIINLLDDVEDGTMTLTKRIRNESGEVILPVNGESFVMQITGNSFDRLVALDANNQYTYTIGNLAYGTYQIEERDSNYAVSYQINGGAQQPQGILEITNGDRNEVLIINSRTAMVFDADNNNDIKIVIE